MTLAFSGSFLACGGPARDASLPPPPEPIPVVPAEPEPEPLHIVETSSPEPALVATAPTTPAPAPFIACGFPSGPPPARSAGGLTVPTTPGKRRFEFAGRLRTHTDGSLGAKSKRVWVGPPVPAFVPLSNGTLELFLLDPSPAGYFALYRDPYDASSCKLSAHENCAFEIAAFDCAGKTLFRVPLAGFLSKKQRLEVQDARYFAGVVYFNEACQSYSREAGGKCSSLIALDPFTKKVLWRTKALTSNNRIMVYEKYIVSGYGFTAEPDFLFVVRRSDGKVMQKVDLPSAHEDLIDGPGSIVAQLERGRGLLFRRDGFDGATPKLVLEGMSEKQAQP